MVPDHIYACVRRDEIWRFDGPGAELIEQRDDAGHAHMAIAEGLHVIRASDEFGERLAPGFTAPREIEPRLREAFSAADAETIRDAIRVRSFACEARILSMARYAESAAHNHLSFSTTAVIRNKYGSITTTAENVGRDLALLGDRRTENGERIEHGDLPMLWCDGSGSVLLHEAIGHPAERDIFAEWPRWLVVTDEPADSIDDTARPTQKSVLTDRERPSALRRADFRSVPLRRMTNLVVSSKGGAIELPARRIEVHLVEEGGFDPLTDFVSVRVQRASLVDSSGFQPVTPFTFSVRRNDIARRLLGARGPQRRYAGTICSEEGQRLPVGCVAPDLLIGPAS